MEEGKIHREGHATRPECIDAEEPGTGTVLVDCCRPPWIGNGLHLNEKGLELAQRRIYSSSKSIFGDEAGNVHAQITERSEEDETIDGFIEGLEEVEAEEDEEDTDDGEDGHHSFGDDKGKHLGRSEALHRGY